MITRGEHDELDALNPLTSGQTGHLELNALDPLTVAVVRESRALS